MDEPKPSAEVPAPSNSYEITHCRVCGLPNESPYVILSEPTCSCGSKPSAEPYAPHPDQRCAKCDRILGAVRDIVCKHADHNEFEHAGHGRYGCIDVIMLALDELEQPKPSAEVRGERPAPRPDGWYWVKFEPKRKVDWEAVWWDSKDHEWIVGKDIHEVPVIVHEIGPRIPSPDSPPPVTPQELREIADLLSAVPRSGAASRRQLDQAALKLRTWAINLEGRSHA